MKNKQQIKCTSVEFMNKMILNGYGYGNNNEKDGDDEFPS